MNTKLIVVLGPTATGKSELAVKLAKKCKGEIICADSRTIYKELNIGTAKPEGHWIATKIHGREFRKLFLYKNIPHHLIDFVDPKKTFSAADFVKKAKRIIAEIEDRNHLPIICGGTGFWIDALFNPRLLADVAPNAKLRRQLEKFSTQALLARLKKIDPERARIIDPNNRRRIIRAIEVSTHAVIPVKAGIQTIVSKELNTGSQVKPGMTNYDVLYLGLTLPNAELKKRIRKRFLLWLKQGLSHETKKLAKLVSRKRLKEIGLSYPIVAKYHAKKITKEQMIEYSVNSIYRYAKRQKTWFKKNKAIKWIDASTANLQAVEKFIKRFILPAKEAR